MYEPDYDTTKDFLTNKNYFNLRKTRISSIVIHDGGE